MLQIHYKLNINYQLKKVSRSKPKQFMSTKIQSCVLHHLVHWEPGKYLYPTMDKILNQMLRWVVCRLLLVVHVEKEEKHFNITMHVLNVELDFLIQMQNVQIVLVKRQILYILFNVHNVQLEHFKKILHNFNAMTVQPVRLH